MAYSLSFKNEKDIEGHRAKIMDMEKNSSSFWQPQLVLHKSGGKAQVVLNAGMLPSVSGYYPIGVDNLAEYNNLYQKVPKGYKSSGNEGYYYYHSDELEKLNAMNMATMNFTKNNLKNAERGFSGKPQVYKSILDVLEDNTDYSQLKQPVHSNRVNTKSRIGKIIKFSEDKNTPVSLDDKDIIDRITTSFNASQSNKALKGGKINQASFKRAFKKALPAAKLISTVGLKIALPEIGKAAASALDLPPSTGNILGKLVAEILGKAINSKSKSAPQMTEREKLMLEEIIKSAKTQELPEVEGGKISKSDVVKASKKSLKIAKKIAPTAVKIGLPVTTGVLAQSLGIPAPVGSVLGALAAQALTSKAKGGVSEYKGGRKPSKERVKKYDQRLFDNLISVARQDGVLKGGGIEHDVFMWFLKGLWEELKESPVNLFRTITGLGVDLSKELGVSKKLATEMITMAKKLSKVKKPESSKVMNAGKKKVYSSDTPQKRRAALVKKVMADKGLSMIAASSFIKKEGMKY